MPWRAYVRLARVSALPTVWTGALAGVALGGGPLDERVIAGLGVALSLCYLGGAYLNDAFDREEDARWHPDRPIPSGSIRARQVFAIGAAMLAAGALLLGAVGFRWAPPVNWFPLEAGIVLGGIILFYDALHLRDPLSPLLLAACRVLVCAIGALAVAAALGPAAIDGLLAILSYAVAVGFLGTQDQLPRPWSLWPLILLVPPLAYTFPRAVWGEVAAIYAGFAAWILAAAVGALRRGRAARAVAKLMAGFCLLDAALIARTGETQAAGLAMLGFVATMVLQRWDGPLTLASPRRSGPAAGGAMPQTPGSV
jgi:hypothetical protein